MIKTELEQRLVPIDEDGIGEIITLDDEVIHSVTPYNERFVQVIFLRRIPEKKVRQSKGQTTVESQIAEVEGAAV